jgi:hypothetical protein
VQGEQVSSTLGVDDRVLEEAAGVWQRFWIREFTLADSDYRFSHLLR